MKKNYLIVVLLMLLGYGLKGQTAPSNFINYQGVARDANGELLVESTINLGIGLRFGTENAPVSYQETHNLLTDANGVFSLRIGNGAASTGDYASLPWGSAASFITVSINGAQLGTTEIMAVPYAISSGDGRQTAAEVPYDNTTSGLPANNVQEALDALVGGGSINTDNQGLVLTGDVLTIEGGTGSVDLSLYRNDEDADPTNELQSLSFDIATNALSLSNGNTVTIPSGGTDADADPMNEIQDISLDGTQISITNGSTIDLAPLIPPGGTDDQNLELTGDVLSIEGGTGSVDLSTYINDADADANNEIQDISLDGTEISITSGSTIDLAPLIPPGGTDDQNLELTGDVLSIEGGLGSVDLSTYINDADFDPLNEVDVTAQTGILLGDGADVTGLVGTTDGQVPKWDTTASAWILGADETGGGTGTSPWQLNGNAVFYDNGNVGIGLTAPNAPLHVHQDAAASNSLYTTTDTGDAANDGLFVGLTNRLGDGFTGEIINQEAGGLYLGTNGLDRIRIMPDGQVGIGGIFPEEALDVEGTIRTRDLAGAGLRNVVADAEGNLVIGAGGGADGDSDPMNEIQDISLDGTEISITSGSTIDLAPLIPPGGTDDQNLELTGDVLSIEGGLGSVDLSTYIDDADADANNEIQDISLDGTEISITNGSTIDLAPIIPPGGTDDQNLELTGDVLSIEGGLGSVDLSTYINDADFDPLNEVDVTAQTGILLGDGTDVTGLVGTTDGQVPKWDAVSSAWVPGDDEVGTGSGGAEELNDLSDAKKTENSLFIGESAGILINGNNITAIGQGALAADTSGELPGNNNTAIGRNALNNNIEGGSNTAIGNATLSTNLSGNRNSAVGSSALNANRLGSDNTALGSLALLNNTANGNTAVGSAALQENTDGTGNTALGFESLQNNTVSNVTAVGSRALKENTTGQENTAIGSLSLTSNTTGDRNTGVGFESLASNTVGFNNIAIGSRALTTNTMGNDNIALGHSALRENTTGINNIAMGSFSLVGNTIGNNNSALGYLALRSNSTGSNNTAIGSFVLEESTTGTNNVAVGSFALDINTTGNGNTALGTNTLGANRTGDNNTAIGLNALRNSRASNLTAVGFEALRDNTSGAENTAIGSSALTANTTGSVNTAVGELALFNNTSGAENTALGASTLANNTTAGGNTAIGARALSQNIAQWNTAVGSFALTFNTTGVNNTAVGRSALSNNTEGIQNTAVGLNALTSNISGGNNTAMGAIALSSNTTGSRNTAFGSGALFFNESGENNSAIGVQALRSNTTGFENTAVGYDALLGNTGGIRNTAIGGAALVNNTAGSNNVAIGRSALFENTNGRNNTAVGLAALLRNTIGNDNTAVGFNALFNLISGNNNIAIGESAQVPNSTGSNQVRIGNTNIALAQIQVAWTVTSDQRWKTDIRDLSYGLNMVNQLRPVDYLRKNNEHQTRETGFIAQEVETVLKQLGYENQGILTKDDKGYMSLRYNDFVPILTKAIQEQQDQIEGLRKTNENMRAQLDSLQEQINALVKHTGTNEVVSKK